ncbi:fibronectin type III domain-containing protein [Micromonospora zamorensis]|uniref:fibronectin type III domain-containing protein n=1 Tax=Micromonospora zamorensis TaxID=709883 RepID=UPI003D8C8B46
MTWTTSTDTGGSGLAGYEVTRTSAGADPVVTASTGASLAVTGLAPERTYQFTVWALDGAGNRSAASAALSVTTPAGPAPDTTPPTAPGTPTAAAVGPTGLTLAWGRPPTRRASPPTASTGAGTSWSARPPAPRWR